MSIPNSFKQNKSMEMYMVATYYGTETKTSKPTETKPNPKPFTMVALEENGVMNMFFASYDLDLNGLSDTPPNGGILCDVKLSYSKSDKGGVFVSVTSIKKSISQE